MSSWAINTLRRVANNLQSFGDGRVLSDAPGSFLLLLELVYREILVQEQLDGHSLSSRAGTLVSRVLYSMRLLQDSRLSKFAAMPRRDPAVTRDFESI